MYKLENNVAWTQELKDAFKHNITRAKIIYEDNIGEISDIGENITLNGTTNKKFKVAPLPRGNSEQETYEGYNLLDMSQAKGGTSNGITCTINEDGSYTFRGTATHVTVNVWLLGTYNDTAPILFTLPAGTYYINDVLLYNNKDRLNDPAVNKIVTFTSDTNITGVRAPYAISGKTYNETKYPIIALSNTEMDWERYTYGQAPNPNYECPISAVGDDVNLFDKAISPVLNLSATKTEIDKGIRITNTSTGTGHSVVFKLLDVSNYVGKSFTLKAKFIASSTNTPTIKMGLGDENGTNRVTGGSITVSGESLTYTIPTITTSSKYLTIWFFSNTNEATINTYVDYTEIKLELGSTATPYSPYGMGNVNVSIGNKNQWKFESEDFTSQGASSWSDVKGNTVSTASGYNNSPNKMILPAGTFYFSFNNSINIGYFMIVTLINNTITNITNAVSASSSGVSFSLEKPTEILVRGRTIEANVTTNLGNIQIEEGSTATSYVPHEEQTFNIPTQKPMYGVEDYFDWKNQEEVHGWGVKVFDGTETWNSTNVVKTIYTTILKDLVAEVSVDANIVGYSNYFIVHGYNHNETGQLYFHPNKNLQLNNTDLKFETVADWKAFLAEKYANGNPVYIIYPLANPERLPLTQEQSTILEQIAEAHTYRNVTHINSTTNPSPSFQVEAYTSTPIEINYDNGLKEITLEDNVYVPDTGFIGQAVAKKATLTLLDNEQTTNLENKEFELYIGADYNGQTYYINYGNFIVNEAPENDDTNGTIKVVAYDYMIKFNQMYEDQVIYPLTLKKYLENICKQAGVELGSESFTNDSFMVTDNQFEGKQLRDVLKHIGKCAFSWARIGQDNKLYLDFEVTDNITETFTIDEYKLNGYKKANEYYGPINKVTYGDSDIQGQEISVPTVDPQDVKELVINDNYFAYTLDKRNQLIQAGEALFGFTYMPVTQLDLTGAIYLDCTDVIEVLDSNENSIITRVFSHTIKYNGIISDSITTEGITDTQQTYENMNTPVSATNRTEISVDRANKKLQSIASEIGDRSQKTTTITQDIDGIESLVQDIEDLTNTIEELKTVTISDAYAGANILELHIYGNNQIFSYLYPADNLYPADDLFPYGDSKIRFYNSAEDRTIDLGIDEVLRANSEVKDEVFINSEGDVYLIRRVNANGTTKATEETTFLGNLTFVLQEGDNTFEIVNYSAPIEVKYATKNDFTDIFATKAEMSSSITQTATEINLEVSKKVDENEVISKINQSAEQISIEAEKISLSGKTLNLADNMAIVSNNFNVDSKGNMTCNDAKIVGGYLELGGDASYSNLVLKGEQNDWGNFQTSIYPAGLDILMNDKWGLIQLNIEEVSGPAIGHHIMGELQINDENYTSSTVVDALGITTPSVTQTSLEENKKNFEKFLNGLEVVLNTDIYKYNLKSESDEAKKHIGFVIGGKYHYSKEITSLNNDGVDIYSMVSVAYKAIQEQQEQIEQLQTRIKELEEK